MASNTYSLKTVDGNVYRMTRTVPQGRPPKDADLVKVKAEFMTLRVTKERLQNQATLHGMSFSAYIDLIVSVFDTTAFSS